MEYTNLYEIFSEEEIQKFIEAGQWPPRIGIILPRLEADPQTVQTLGLQLGFSYLDEDPDKAERIWRMFGLEG